MIVPDDNCSDVKIGEKARLTVREFLIR